MISEAKQRKTSDQCSLFESSWFPKIRSFYKCKVYIIDELHKWPKSFSTVSVIQNFAGSCKSFYQGSEQEVNMD